MGAKLATECKVVVAAAGAHYARAILAGQAFAIRAGLLSQGEMPERIVTAAKHFAALNYAAEPVRRLAMYWDSEARMACLDAQARRGSIAPIKTSGVTTPTQIDSDLYAIQQGFYAPSRAMELVRGEFCEPEEWGERLAAEVASLSVDDQEFFWIAVAGEIEAVLESHWGLTIESGWPKEDESGQEWLERKWRELQKLTLNLDTAETEILTAYLRVDGEREPQTLTKAMTIDDIGKAFGVHRNTISKRLEDLGAEPFGSLYRMPVKSMPAEWRAKHGLA